jgi:Leucine-rich repeat (LRR) protein
MLHLSSRFHESSTARLAQLHICAQVLDLSGNRIARIPESIRSLVALRVLRLARCLRRRRRLDPFLFRVLISFAVDVSLWSGNAESHRRNAVASLSDLDVLDALETLTSLNLTGNPVADLSQFNLYAVYKLPSLDVLNGRAVTFPERCAICQPL